MRRLQHLPIIVVVALSLVACGEVADGLGQQPDAAATATPAPTETATLAPTATLIVTPLLATQTAALDETACPVTQPPDPPFDPPPPYNEPAHDGAFWYGSASLWTQLQEDGSYDARDFWKMFWWRDGYSWVNEQQPALTVTANRLDTPAPPVEASPVTNGYSEDLRSFMLVGLRLPESGCWEITGQYNEDTVSIVAWIAAAP